MRSVGVVEAREQVLGGDQGAFGHRRGVYATVAPTPAILSRGAATAPPTTGRGRVVHRSGVAQW